MDARADDPIDERPAKIIKLVELPALKLLDTDGNNWTALRRREPLVSKQILMPQLAAGGYRVVLENLKDGDHESHYGEVRWRNLTLTKLRVGRPLQVDPVSADLWAITINYVQERESAVELISYLAIRGAIVVVGGSDAFADPDPYLQAGAAAIVLDKSGAANLPLLDYLLSDHPHGTPSQPLHGALLADGRRFKPRIPPMSPDDWPLPSPGIVKQTLGVDYWETQLPEALLPIGSVMADIGCDRHCDFCETPLYRLGYKFMQPKTVLRWFRAQKAAGARSVICPSDQFLARMLYRDGRDQVLEIMAGIRDMDMVVLWGNGLEIRKTTLGRGMPNSDLTPDIELIRALWGWDGKRGCYQGYIPAERPLLGRESYAKLVPWQEHCALVREIVRAGVPDLTYGVVVGLPEDTHQSMQRLETAVRDIHQQAMAINPNLSFNVTPYAIRPLPGTPQSKDLRERGLLQFDDPAIIGGFWTACANTEHLSYGEVSDWQARLAGIGSTDLMDWQNLTGHAVIA